MSKCDEKENDSINASSSYPRTDLPRFVQERYQFLRAMHWGETLQTASSSFGEKAATEGNIMTTTDGNPQSMIADTLVKIQAPMVRYSRPAFRRCCRLWGTDISYTHMILSDSFVKSSNAREVEFDTYQGESRLIPQFAGTDPVITGQAACIVSPFCDAIDINCGCPQKWAMEEGIGAAMMFTPQIISETVKQVRNQTSSVENSCALPCVVKMRVFEDVPKSVDLARQVASAGASWITIHGRTAKDPPSGPVRYDAIRTIQESVPVPVIANGSVNSLQEAVEMVCRCHVGGVMAGRGLLENPAMFSAPPHLSSLLHAPPLTMTMALKEENPVSCSILPTVEPNAMNSKSSCTASSSHGAPHSATSTHPREELALPDKTRHYFSSRAAPPEVLSDFIRLSFLYNSPMKTTMHHVSLMTHDGLSPSERFYLNSQQSLVGMLKCIQEAGIWTEEGRFSQKEAARLFHSKEYFKAS